MLRISVASGTDGTTVTVEGRIVGPWTEELGSCWRRIARSAVRPIRVSLDGVSFVDSGGKAVLWAMHVDGAILAASTVMMRAVVDDIAGSRSHRST